MAIKKERPTKINQPVPNIKEITTSYGPYSPKNYKKWPTRKNNQKERNNLYQTKTKFLQTTAHSHPKTKRDGRQKKTERKKNVPNINQTTMNHSP